MTVASCAGELYREMLVGLKNHSFFNLFFLHKVKSEAHQSLIVGTLVCFRV